MYTYRRSFSEKRNYVRMQLNCMVTITELEGDHPSTYQGTCVNLSSQGVLLRADRSYLTGTPLKIHISPRLEISPPFTAIVEVIRCMPVSNQGGLTYEFAGIVKSIVPRDEF